MLLDILDIYIDMVYTVESNMASEGLKVSGKRLYNTFVLPLCSF